MSSAARIIEDVLDVSKERWKEERDAAKAFTAGASNDAPDDPDDDLAGGEYSPPDPDDPDDEQPQTMRDRLLTIAGLAKLPPPRPLIEGVLDLDNTSITYGRRGQYKSFIVLDQALCVASGIAWHGHPVAQGVVLYVVGEGVSGVHQRVDAWLRTHPEAEPGERLLLLPEPVNLLSPTAVAEFAATAVEVGASFVILDTLARCLVGGDENSAKDIGMAVEAMDLIRRRTGAHVDIVHHSGKDARAGARGSSALEAAADTVLEVAGTESVVTVATTKQKNRPEGRPLTFRAVLVGASIVLETAYDIGGNLTPKPRLALRLLDEIAGTIGVSLTAWVEAADQHDIGRTTVRRVRIQALKEGWIANGPNGTEKSPKYVVTDHGRAIYADDEETPDDQA